MMNLQIHLFPGKNLFLEKPYSLYNMAHMIWAYIMMKTHMSMLKLNVNFDKAIPLC